MYLCALSTHICEYCSQFESLIILNKRTSCFFNTANICLSLSSCGHYSIAKKAFHRGISPIIIDNTNMQGWEMKPYVAQVSLYDLVNSLEK